MCEAELIVVEGLDGVGKTSVVRVMAGLVNGVDIVREVENLLGPDHRNKLLRRPSLNARYQYWIWFNRKCAELAASVTGDGSAAIVDGYALRTLISHELLGVKVDYASTLSCMVRPHRMILLTADDRLRKERIKLRDGSGKNSWHDFLAQNAQAMLSGYRRFDIVEIDTSQQSPLTVARGVLGSHSARFFRWG